MAIRPEASSQDPTGALQQIMSILGQPLPQAVETSEIVLHMPENMIKTSVQPQLASLMVGHKAMITGSPDTSIRPY
jgi:hypothetical protein